MYAAVRCPRIFQRSIRADYTAAAAVGWDTCELHAGRRWLAPLRSFSISIMMGGESAEETAASPTACGVDRTVPGRSEEATAATWPEGGAPLAISRPTSAGTESAH